MNWILHYWGNLYIALGLFWLPLVLDLVGYALRTWHEYQRDLQRRAAEDPEKGRFYYPELMIGHIVGRFLVSLIPIANLFAAIFNVAPELFGRFFQWVGKVLDYPLVPKKP